MPREVLKTLKERTGLRRQEAMIQLPSILDKLVQNLDGTFHVAKDATRLQLDLINAMCSTIVVRSAIDGDAFYRDLVPVLIESKLLVKNEFKDFCAIRDAIQLFVVAKMHNTKIIIDHSNATKLAASIGGESIAINAPVPMREIGVWSKRFLSAAIYQTGLVPRLHCDDILLSMQRLDDIELELDEDGKLTIIS